MDGVKLELTRTLQRDKALIVENMQERIFEVKREQQEAHKQLLPLLPLLDILTPGKTLIEVITEELSEKVIRPQIDEIKEVTLPLYATREELLEKLDGAQERSLQDISNAKDFLLEELAKLR